jgi:hypothetical protein
LKVQYELGIVLYILDPYFLIHLIPQEPSSSKEIPFDCFYLFPGPHTSARHDHAISNSNRFGIRPFIAKVEYCRYRLYHRNSRFVFTRPNQQNQEKKKEQVFHREQINDHKDNTVRAGRKQIISGEAYHYSQGNPDQKRLQNLP